MAFRFMVVVAMKPNLFWFTAPEGAVSCKNAVLQLWQDSLM
jgi:hypothetical protein